ncbi:MAG: hypothetical protein R2713_05830 [Ilumatobacteraceae bacterium]
MLYPRDLRSHRRRDAAPGTPSNGSPPSAPRTWRPTAWCTPRCDGTELCTGGLTLDEVVEAILDGFRAGAEGTDLTIHLICSAMRTAGAAWRSPSSPSAGATAGVVGFDIAGAEAGYPPTAPPRRGSTTSSTRTSTPPSTPARPRLPSIWEAVQFCGAERLGHGVRIVDDITGAPGEESGRLAAFGDRRIPLELCPTGNVNTGVRLDRGAPDRHAAPAALPRHAQHRQPVDERDVDDPRDAADARCVRVGSRGFEWITINAMKSGSRRSPSGCASSTA